MIASLTHRLFSSELAGLGAGGAFGAFGGVGGVGGAFAAAFFFVAPESF